MNPGKRYAMLIEVDRCIGCYSCELACCDEHSGISHLPLAAAQPHSGDSWISVRQKETGSYPKVKVSYVPVPCLQCADAPCIKAAPDALYRREDGIVVIDPDKARGRRDIVKSCPYGAISWNEELGLAQKCTFCAHLLDAGAREPRCVEACPTQTLVFGDPEDPSSPIAGRLAVVKTEKLPPGVASPVVLYSSLPKPYLAGEVAFGDRMAEPAVGVELVIERNGSTIRCTTDAFGDFEFAPLEAKAEYTLSVSHPGYASHRRQVRTDADPHVGTIVLEHAASGH